MASEADENSSPMASLTSDGDEEESIRLPHGKLYPLNSRRLIAVYLWHIAEALSLPSTGSVQVVVSEYKEVKLSLMDYSWVFVEAPVSRLTKDISECGGLCQEAHARSQQLREDLESVVQDLRKQQSEVSRLTEALEGARSEGMDTLESQLKEEKSKRERMCQMHCQLTWRGCWRRWKVRSHNCGKGLLSLGFLPQGDGVWVGHLMTPHTQLQNHLWAISPKWAYPTVPTPRHRHWLQSKYQPWLSLRQV